MLVNLDHAQTIRVKFVDDRLDTRRLSGTTITKEQDIVGGSAFHERLGIVDQFLFLDLITDQIIQHNFIHVVDGDKLNIASILFLDTEGLIQSKHANTIVFIKSGHGSKESVHILCGFQLGRKCNDLFAHIFIIHEFLFLDGMIIG